MKIKKILNNNVVIARDDDNKEVVVMSLGLGFSKKAGDVFRREDVQKVFVLSDEVRGQYKQLMKDADPRSIEIAEKVISYASDKKNVKTKDLIHLTLTDHIDGMLKRLGENINITNQLTLEISRVYKTEFEIGQYALDKIREATGIAPVIDEAAFIALHFVNNALGSNENTQDVNHVVTFVNDVVKLVESYYKITISEESLYYYRFVTHLKFLSRRISENKVYRDDSTLYDSISKSYPESAKCADKIGGVIKLKYHNEASLEELAYLTIYIEKLARECRENQ